MSNFPTNISQVKIKIGEETSSPVPLTISEEQIEGIKTELVNSILQMTCAKDDIKNIFKKGEQEL